MSSGLELRRLALLLATVACAEDLPGYPPPGDQLHYPVALALEGDRLLVVSSNFDQRYNAGSLMGLSVTALAGAVPAGADAALIAREIPSEGRSQVKISSFGGQVLVVPRGDEPEVYVATRRANRVHRARLVGGLLDCGNGAVAERVLGTDCTPARTVDVNAGELALVGEDPFSLAYVPSGGPRGTVVVGHLKLLETASSEIIGTLALIDPDAMDRNLAAEQAGTLTATASRNVAVIGLGGTSAIAPVPGTEELVAVSADPGLIEDAADLARFTVARTASAGLGLRRRPDVALGRASGADGARGLAISSDGKRAYVSLRLRQRSSVSGRGAALFNSAIAVVSLEEGRVLSVLELGEELGAVALLERDAAPRRLLYAADLRSDRVYVLDVTLDTPALVHAIEPHDEGSTQRKLAAPAQILILPEAARASAGGRTLAFVPNFANSTLAVLDLSDADPRRHRVVARFGRALSDNGTTEVE